MTRVCQAVVMVIVGSGIVLAEVRYRVRAIPRLSIGTQSTGPSDINSVGSVTGVDDSGSGYAHAYLWNAESNQIRNLGSLPTCKAEGASGEAVNDLEHVAGISAGVDCQSEGYLWTSEAGMVGIGDLPGGSVFSEAHDINNNDQIVGQSVTENQLTRAFLWTPDHGMMSLGALGPTLNSRAYGINDSGWVVGVSGAEAFLWRPGIGMMPLGGPEGVAGPHVYGRANDINELGQVTGDAFFEGGLQPYLWDPIRGAIPAGRLRPDDGGSPRMGVGVGINNLGQIVGYEDVNREDGYRDVPIIWDERRGLRDLSTLLNPCFNAFGADAIFLRATAINDDGWITVSRIGRGAVLIPYIPGDLDEDADCDLQDLAYLLANFGRTEGANYAAGDLDCDQDVDLEDLAILLANFGETLP